MPKLSRKEAIALITPVIDGEATSKDRRAFFEYLEQDEKVKQLYEQELETKLFLKKNLSNVKAPPELYQFVEKVEKHANYADYPKKECLKDLPKSGNSKKTRYFIYSAVAALFLVGFLFLFNYLNITQQPGEAATVIEEQATHHYETLLSSDSEPGVEQSSIESAQNIVREEMELDITVPDLQDASFNGMDQSEFIDGFITPVFVYECPNEHPIYVFAFDMDKLAESLKPDKKASESCKTESDYHITEVNGYQLVSWRWGETWYTAISEHQGEHFAEMLPR